MITVSSVSKKLRAVHYALHSTASAIVFLVKAEQEMKP